MVIKNSYPGLGFRAKVLKNLNAFRVTGRFLSHLKASENQCFLFPEGIEIDQQHENELKEEV